MNKSTKTNNLFKILFFITVPLILVGATVIVLIISQGVTVTNEGIVGDYGVVRLNTDPVNIDYNLFIDDELVESLNNKGTNIKSGEHVLRIEAIGMSNWEKQVSITKGVVNEIFAKLFPEELSLVQLTNTNIQKAFMNTDGDYIFYVINQAVVPEDNGIWRMQLSTSNLPFLNAPYNVVQISEFDDTTLEIINKNNYQLFPSPDNNKVLIIDNETNAPLIVSTKSTSQPINILYLNEILGYAPEHIRWFKNSNTLLINNADVLFAYDFSTNISTLIDYAPNQKLIFNSNNDQLILLAQNTKGLSLYINDKATKIIFNKDEDLITAKNIEEIYTPERSNRFVTIKSELGYQLIDLQKEVIKDLSDLNSDLLLQSPDGLAYVFQTESGLISVTIKENIALNTLEVKTMPLNITLDINDKLHFVPQSNCLLYYNDLEKSLYTLDRDGSNSIKLLQNENINGTFNFDINASNLILTMKSEPQVNLYRINLLK